LQDSLSLSEIAHHRQGVTQSRVPSRLTGAKLLQRVDVSSERDDGLRDVSDDAQEVVPFDRVSLALREMVAELVRTHERSQCSAAFLSYSLERDPQQQMGVREF